MSSQSLGLDFNGLAPLVVFCSKMDMHPVLRASAHKIRQTIVIQVPEGKGGQFVGDEEKFLYVRSVFKRGFPSVGLGRTNPGGLPILGPVEKLDSGPIQIVISQILQAILVQIMMLKNSGIPSGLHNLRSGKQKPWVFFRSQAQGKTEKRCPTGKGSKTGTHFEALGKSATLETTPRLTYFAQPSMK